MYGTFLAEKLTNAIQKLVDLYTDARFDNLATEENEEADLIQEPISHNPHIPM
jgi:hypothetical protein